MTNIDSLADRHPTKQAPSGTVWHRACAAGNAEAIAGWVTGGALQAGGRCFGEALSPRRDLWIGYDFLKYIYIHIYLDLYLYLYIQRSNPPRHGHGSAIVLSPLPPVVSWGCGTVPLPPVVWWGCGTVPLSPCGVVGVCLYIYMYICILYIYVCV